MKRLPASLHVALATKWTNRRRFPSDKDTETALLNLLERLQGKSSRAAFDRKKSKLTRLQMHVAAMADFAACVAYDGIALGVVVNEPSIVLMARDAANAHSLPTASKLIDRVLKAVPMSVLLERNINSRLAWANSEDADSLHKLEESAQLEKARREMLLTAVRLTIEHPRDFFNLK